ncbi:MAG TPA: hypothetical protein VI636_23525 [Candidatus Angelobacter sp.]
MKRSSYAKLTLCIVLVLAVSSICTAQVYAPQPFSADFASTSANGTKVNGKWYFAPPNFRWDANANGQNVSMIVDGNTQTSYMVMHDRHMYIETHSNQSSPFARQMPLVPRDFDPKNPCAWAMQHDATSCKSLGTEMANGRLCDKYQGTAKDGKTTGTGWIDQKMHFPIKWVSSDGALFDLTNIKEGRPDASLFQPPSGYQKMNIPNMPGGRPPQ